MIKTVVLICSLPTAPQDCTRDTAIDIIDASSAKSPMMCGFFGQAQIAPTKVAPEAGKTWMKIVCERTRETAAK